MIFEQIVINYYKIKFIWTGFISNNYYKSKTIYCTTFFKDNKSEKLSCIIFWITSFPPHGYYQSDVYHIFSEWYSFFYILNNLLQNTIIQNQKKIQNKVGFKKNYWKDFKNKFHLSFKCQDCTQRVKFSSLQYKQIDPFVFSFYRLIMTYSAETSRAINLFFGLESQFTMSICPQRNSAAIDLK